jgi:hypothetical protein
MSFGIFFFWCVLRLAFCIAGAIIFLFDIPRGSLRRGHDRFVLIMAYEMHYIQHLNDLYLGTIEKTFWL